MEEPIFLEFSRPVVNVSVVLSARAGLGEVVLAAARPFLIIQ